MTDSRRLTLEPTHPDVIDSAKLQQLAQDAQAKFNELSPEEQMFYRFAQKSKRRLLKFEARSLSKEEVARQLLAHDVSEKYAKWMLQKPRLREFLGI